MLPGDPETLYHRAVSSTNRPISNQIGSALHSAPTTQQQCRPQYERERKHMHSYRHGSLGILLLAGSTLLAIVPAVAADVTPARLANPEPGNWLMNHRTYDA